jgi:hypothetical protein
VISDGRCMLKEDRLYMIYQACKGIPKGAKKAVDEFLDSIDNFYFVYLLTAQCLIVKTKAD